MGGAFVAVAEDSLAQYWNPAGMATQASFDIGVPANAKAEFTGQILKDASTLSGLADRFAKVQSAQKNGNPLDVDQFASVLQTLETLGGLNKPDKGVLVEAQGGLNMRRSHFALSVNNFTSAGASPFADTRNIGLGASAGNSGVNYSGSNIADPADPALISARDTAKAAIDTIGFNNLQQLIGPGLTSGCVCDSTKLANALVNTAAANGLSAEQIREAAVKMANSAPAAKPVLQNADSGNPYSDNSSNATLRGISLFEVSLGYGHRFFLNDLSWGLNLKVLSGRVGYYKQQILTENVNGNNVFSDYDKNTKQSIQPGVDLGLLYDKRESWRTKLGVVARNVNSPSFDQPDAAAANGEQRYRVPAQVRAGLAFYPFKNSFWVIASDVDLTSNITPIPGFSSRMWGLGTELNVGDPAMLGLALRAGVMNNMAEAASKPTLTAGVGLKISHFFLDVAGAVSTGTQEVNSESSGIHKVPQNAQVGVALGLNW